MRIIFLADRQCALAVNDLHLGVVDGFERGVELQPSNDLFCKLYPSDGSLPLCFCLNEQFLLSPPEGIRLYYTRNGVAIYAFDFMPADQSMKVLWQKRLKTSLLTLVFQGKLQLNVENEKGFHLIHLPSSMKNATVQEKEGEYLLSNEQSFYLISHEGEILLHADGKVLEWGNALKAEVPFHDSLQHVAICEWSGSDMISCSIRSTSPPSSATLCVALFESALIGADCTPFLSPELQEKASSLKEYLGEYVSVAFTDEENVVGLVTQKSERVFELRYFKVTVTDDKISNVQPVEL